MTKKKKTKNENYGEAGRQRSAWIQYSVARPWSWNLREEESKIWMFVLQICMWIFTWWTFSSQRHAERIPRSVWYPPFNFLRCSAYADMSESNECRKLHAEKQMSTNKYGDKKPLRPHPLTPSLAPSPSHSQRWIRICIQKNALPNAFDFWNSRTLPILSYLVAKQRYGQHVSHTGEKSRSSTYNLPWNRLWQSIAKICQDFYKSFKSVNPKQSVFSRKTYSRKTYSLEAF